jgi:hypothetical protein
VAEERTESDVSREQIRTFRRIVAAAVAEIRSQQIRDSYASLSLEELIDQHIELLEGTNDPLRKSRKQRVQKVYDDLANNIEAIKATPPSRFRRADRDADANTPPNPDATPDPTTGAT